MDSEDVFLLRLNLLIVMVKASLKGYPAGEHRKQSVLENAATLHRMALDPDLCHRNKRISSHLFKERVKLLSIMATAIISEEYPLGIYRRDAVYENIRNLSEHAFPEHQFKLFPDILKVA
ncbi:MAG: hypothetical protein D3926_18760 [Desulfobacteraceae bacterium]|nr:MAG: hypothetical protein D3926_18760 [Desulfobacteraceae bacterium]